MEIPYFATHERPRCRADPGRSARAGERSGARPRDGDADGPAERPFRHGAGRRLRPAEGSRRFGRTTAAPPRRSTGGLGRGSAGAGRFHERSFLPGRGLLDMKSGIAAGIAVVEAFAADPARRGNLLFAATPDEEDDPSACGRRPSSSCFSPGARPRVPLAINLDAICDDGDGSSGRVVAFGCIGKLLLSALVVGRNPMPPTRSPESMRPTSRPNSRPKWSSRRNSEKRGRRVGGPSDRPRLAGSESPVQRDDPRCRLDLLERPPPPPHSEGGHGGGRDSHPPGARPRCRPWPSAPPPHRDPSPERRLGGHPDPHLRGVARSRAAPAMDFAARFAVLGEELGRQGDLDLPTRSRRLVEATWVASGLKGRRWCWASARCPTPPCPGRPGPVPRVPPSRPRWQRRQRRSAPPSAP